MSDSSAPQPARIPVICEKCRATGMAGDEAFAAIPDLLDFEPVPRRPRADGWTPEHQRAFIAALAITGSVRQAARHVGRAAFGAEQLRMARGGRSFAAAWDSALELARDRELSRLHENLGDLAKKTEEANAHAKASGRLVAGADELGDGEEGSYERELEGARERLFEKLQKLRRNMLRDEIIPFPEKRAAWIVLNGEEEILAVEGANPVRPEQSRRASSPTRIGDPPSSPSPSRQDKPVPSSSRRPGPRLRSL